MNKFREIMRTLQHFQRFQIVLLQDKDLLNLKVLHKFILVFTTKDLIQ